MDIENLQDRLRRSGSGGGIHYGRGAGLDYYPADQPILSKRRSFSFRDRRRDEDRIPSHCRRRIRPADRRSAARDSLRMEDPPPDAAEYRKLAAARSRGAQPCARGHSAGARALPYLLGRLARPAHHGLAAQGHRRPAAANHAPAPISIEAANARHEHEWRVWQEVKLPEGKILIPGVVSHATNVVEHPELVAERIVRFADVVGRENVIAGTDCGLGGRLHRQLVWAKLKALAEGARLATRRLWGRA